MKQVKAIGYGRTSSENLGAVDSATEKVSVSVQRSAFEQACKSNGWENCGWYEDRDVSGRCYPTGATIASYDTVTADYIAGKSLSKQGRKGLTDAFLHASKVGASVLWCKEETRFYRPLSGSMLSAFLRGELARFGLTLWSGEQGKIDFKNFSTNIVQNLQNEIKSHDIEVKTKASIESKDKLRDKGYATSSTFCYGYRNTGKQIVSVVPEQAEIVKRIFTDYTRGQSVNSICKALTMGKVGTFSAGTVWNRQALRRILQRPYYCGMTRNTSGEIIPSLVYPALISVETWNKAQIRLGQSKATAGSRESKFAHSLSGLIRCGICGHIMRPYHNQQTVKGTKYGVNYYTCKSCEMQGIRNLIREAVAPLPLVGQEKGYLGEGEKEPRYPSVGLVEFLYPFTLAGYIRQLNAKDVTPELQARRDQIKADSKALDAKIAQRYSDFEEGILPRSVFLQLSKEGKELQTKFQALLSDIESQISASASKVRLTVEDIGSLQDMSYSTYTALLKEVVSEVVVYKDRVELVLTDRDTPLSVPRVAVGMARGLPPPTVEHAIDGGIYEYPSRKVIAPSAGDLVPAILVTYATPDKLITIACSPTGVLQLS